MRSYEELKDASGYAQSPRDFDTILEILSTELRLITPTDPGGSHPDDVEQSGHLPGRYYHLTHDYLVPSVRNWLTRKQRETQRGRAEIRLSAITNLWKDRPSNRLLPSLLEWLEILALTRPRFRSTDERRMIRAATRHYLIGLGLAVCLILIGTYAFREFRTRERATALLARAVKSELRQVPDLLGPVSASWQHLAGRPWNVSRRNRRHPSANARWSPSYFMRAILRNSAQPSCTNLWSPRDRRGRNHPRRPRHAPRSVRCRSAQAGASRRIDRSRLSDSAACVLAKLRPADVGKQDNLANLLTQALLAEDRRSIGGWIELLTPSLGLFLEPLSGICRDLQTDPTMLATAAEALGETLVRRGDSVGLGRAVVESRPEASNIPSAT